MRGLVRPATWLFSSSTVVLGTMSEKAAPIAMTSSAPSTTNFTPPVLSRFTSARAVPMIGVESGAMIMAPMTVAVESARIPAQAMHDASASIVQKAERLARMSPSLRSRSEVSSSSVRRWFSGSTRALQSDVHGVSVSERRGSRPPFTSTTPARPTHPGMPAPLVRDATASDAAACAAIYAPYVTDTAVTFETEPPTVAEMAVRIEGAQRRHAWLVLEQDGSRRRLRLCGPVQGACGLPLVLRGVGLPRPVTAAAAARGRLLYEALLARLTERGFRMAAAGMTQPNEASGRLHAALGFEPVGTFRAVGWKHGAWRDVTWVQRPLAGALPAGEDPPEPV